MENETGSREKSDHLYIGELLAVLSPCHTIAHNNTLRATNQRGNRETGKRIRRCSGNGARNSDQLRTLFSMMLSDFRFTSLTHLLTPHWSVLTAPVGDRRQFSLWSKRRMKLNKQREKEVRKENFQSFITRIRGGFAIIENYAENRSPGLDS